MPSSAKNQQQQALKLLERHGMMRLSELMAHGIHPPTLARLVEKGEVVRPARGLYELADREIELAHSLAALAKRVPRGVICLISALQYHESTVQMPRSIWMAVGERDRIPRIDTPPARFVRFGGQALTLGVETHRIDSVPVKIFDPAKTVVDCFRFRNTVGLDVALEGLRMALQARKASPDAIAGYARKLRIWTVLRPYLESAAAHEG